MKAKVLFTGFFVIDGLLGPIPAAFAQHPPPESEKAKQIIALVEKAATLIDSKGKAVFPEFRKIGSEWLYDDTYLFIWDMQGVQLFNAAYPQNDGVNAIGTKDSNGKLFIAELVRVAQSMGSGWVDYTLAKPGESQPSNKWSYVKAVKIDGTPGFVGAGFYGQLATAAVEGCTLNQPWTLSEGQHPQSFEKQITTTIVCERFLLFLPEGFNREGKKWPLIVFLHGAGEAGNDLEKVKAHGPPMMVEKQRDFPFIVVSPQAPEGSTFDRDALNALLDELIEELPVDADRIYLTGLSLGGFASWAWASERPERFAAIAPISGAGNPKYACKLKRTAIWAFHGAKDDVVPIQRDQEIVEAVKACGGDVKFTVYRDGTHDAWTETYANPNCTNGCCGIRGESPQSSCVTPGRKPADGYCKEECLRTNHSPSFLAGAPVATLFLRYGEQWRRSTQFNIPAELSEPTVSLLQLSSRHPSQLPLGRPGILERRGRFLMARFSIRCSRIPGAECIVGGAF